ncbi:MAG: type III secretion system export apparatus subunit SctU [Candidimonas sp.]
MSGEKTEQPTSKRLRDARKKGDVAHSKDFTQTLLILALFGYLLGDAEQLVGRLGRIILAPSTLMGMEFGLAVRILLDTVVKEMVNLLLPFILIVLMVGMFAEFIQVGIVLAFEKLKPSGKKLNVVSNLKNMFSVKNFVEFLKSSLKILILSSLVFFIVRDDLSELVRIPHAGLDGVVSALGSMLYVLIVNIAVAYSVIALADLVWQRFQYRKGLKMSKSEVKQEYKEMEGDAIIKSKRKHLHQEMAMQNSVARTRKATVVVTNPTHYAVALYYDDDETPLPVVLAKGEGELARRMVAAAREEGIPVMRNVPLTRALIEKGELDQYIPTELVEPVAEVLKLVRQLAQGRGYDDDGEAS